MARKMTKRSTKRGPKVSQKKKTTTRKTKMTKAATPNTASMIKKMEKEFMQAPAKIVAQINKDLKSIKQKEIKLSKAANKNQHQLHNAESRLVSAEKSSHTAAGKKRFKIMQRKHDALVKAQDKLNQQVETHSGRVTEMENQQAKFNAIIKQLAQFDKDWAKNSKMNASAANAKTKNRKQKQKDVEIPNNIATIERTQTDDVQTLFDEISLDESSETAVG